ncbi:MAG: AIPR family protein [Candidatus Thermoplasmatota archaeon]|nr:AIPR family protein [Candidatus Thermoplasmatota archaeon]MCL6002276.1 AIPR family protein [Candidatus Thermoplasmatota archaeon]
MEDRQINNSGELTNYLRTLSDKEATRELTRYFTKARFKVSDEDFKEQYVDGKDDGGIDFYYKEDNTFYIIQTKFVGKQKAAAEGNLWEDIRKILNSVSNDNPNRKADEFVHQLREQNDDLNANLEVIWLTTDRIKKTDSGSVEKRIRKFFTEKRWKLNTAFSPVDSSQLDSVIYDVNHGFIPYTGRKEIQIVGNRFLRYTEGDIDATVCTANIHEILKWFDEERDVQAYLQKNVREFLGANRINKGIQKSFTESPSWFWYKHNGMMIFADQVTIDEELQRLVLRNPQVVNGGQTLRALYQAYYRNRNAGKGAQILIRAYRLPYENNRTYSNSIDIIAALNTQNNILPSDLRSTDPRQVRLEELFNLFNWTYYRKRTEGAKASQSNVLMKRLGLLYLVCKHHLPHEGVRGNVEEVFSEPDRYEDAFPEEKIKQEISKDHPVIDYITTWRSYNVVNKIGKKSVRYKELLRYSQHFVSAYLYEALDECKTKAGALDLKLWIKFLGSEKLQVEITGNIHRALEVSKSASKNEQDVRAYFMKKESMTNFDKGIRRYEKGLKKSINDAWKNYQG